MAFGNITAVYVPIAANAGSSLWGTDVRLLRDTADAAGDNTTIMNHGTGGSVTRTTDPYTQTSSDLDQSLYGWAIRPTDMNSLASARRFFPAGNHTATWRINNNSTATASGTLTMYVYRVGPAPTRTRTLLGSGSNASVSINAVSTATVTVTAALAEIIFEEDETIQYSFETTFPGVAITGRGLRFFDGTASGVPARVDTPKLGVLMDTTGSAAGSGAASATSGLVLATVGASAGAGSASGSMSSTAASVGAANGVGSAAGAASSLAATTGTAAGVATAAGAASIVLGTVGTVNIAEGGADTTIKRPIMLVDD